MLTVKRILPTVLIISLILTLGSCDDTTSSDEADVSDAPEIPSFSDMEMETETFDEGSYSINKQLETDENGYQIQDQLAGNALKKAMDEVLQLNPDQFPSYQVASAFVITFEGLHQSNANIMNAYFSDWSKDNAELSDDEYVWSYDTEDPETGNEFSIQVSANVAGDEANWAVVAEMEGEFDEQQIMQGSSALDGSTGNWTFTLDVPADDYSVESSNSWVLDDDNKLTEMDFDFSMSRSDTYADANGKYELDGNTGRIYDANIDEPGLEEAAAEYDIDLTETFEVEWNVDNEDGMITIGNDSFCWDQDHLPVDC